MRVAVTTTGGSAAWLCAEASGVTTRDGHGLVIDLQQHGPLVVVVATGGGVDQAGEKRHVLVSERGWLGLKNAEAGLECSLWMTLLLTAFPRRDPGVADRGIAISSFRFF